MGLLEYELSVLYQLPPSQRTVECEERQEGAGVDSRTMLMFMSNDDNVLLTALVGAN